MKVDLIYFKKSGKYYSSGSYVSNKSFMYQVFEEVEKNPDIHPDLSMPWDGFIFVNSDEEVGYPGLIDCTNRRV